MDKTGIFTIGLDFPFNKETTVGWFDDAPEMNLQYIESAVNTIRISIRKHGYISCTKVLRLLGVWEQPNFPNIFFEKLDEYDIVDSDDGYLVRMYLTGSFEIIPIPGKSTRKKEKAKLRIVEETEKTEKHRNPKPVLKHSDDIYQNTFKPEILPKVTARDENGKAVAGRYSFEKERESEGAECQTGLKEISGSEENGKT